MMFRIAALARMLLVAALCVAVTAFALPVTSAGKAQDHALAVDEMADHGHDSGPHDQDSADQGHSERHAPDHSHDTPAVIFTAIGGQIPPFVSAPHLPEPRIASFAPSPHDRPPDSLTHG
jgi:ABC-type nickel/cobalt efflux system permease component RcnA